MRALSVRQPWAWLIMYAGKDVENRSWRTDYRGEILIHAGKRWDNDIRVGTKNIYLYALENLLDDHGLSFDFLKRWAAANKRQTLADAFQLGGVIGKVEIVDCVQNHESQWAVDGQWHWVLANPQPLDFYLCKGRLGLFDIKEFPQQGPFDRGNRRDRA